MSKGALNFTNDNEYYTPKELVNYFGTFDYDPATVPEKAAEFNITQFDTIETDGLTKDWSKYSRIWINPPFTIKHMFLDKACKTYKENPQISIFILVPIEFLTTKRFHEITKDVGAKIYLPNGRLKFQSGLGKKSNNPAFGSVVLKLQDTWQLENLNIEELM